MVRLQIHAYNHITLYLYLISTIFYEHGSYIQFHTSVFIIIIFCINITFTRALYFIIPTIFMLCIHLLVHSSLGTCDLWCPYVCYLYHYAPTIKNLTYYSYPISTNCTMWPWWISWNYVIDSTQFGCVLMSLALITSTARGIGFSNLAYLQRNTLVMFRCWIQNSVRWMFSQHKWVLCCQKQVYQAGINNCIPQNTMGCNNLSLSEIPASDSKVHKWAVPS